MKIRTGINMNYNPLRRINTYEAKTIKKVKEKDWEKEKIERKKTEVRSLERSGNIYQNNLNMSQMESGLISLFSLMGP